MRRVGFALLGAFVGSVLGAAGGGQVAGILGLVGAIFGFIVAPRRRPREERREGAGYPSGPAAYSTHPSPGQYGPPPDRGGEKAALDDLLRAAVEQGVIDAAAASRLRAFRDRLWLAPGAVPAAAGGPAPAAGPAVGGLRYVSEPGATLRQVPRGAMIAFLPAGSAVTQVGEAGGWVRVVTQDGRTGWIFSGDLIRSRPAAAPSEPGVVPPQPAASPRAPAPPVPAPTRPAPAAAPVSAPRPAPAPRPAAAPRPAPVPAAPSILEVALRGVGKGFKAAWKRFSADVAIHTVTYIGVLLLVVVIFVFFVGGFFGDVFKVKDLRPVVEVALPLLLFGIAWLLRSRTGIPFTADAIGLIAALVLPICLAASFRDGSLCCPPDLNGSARWLGYVGVGVVWALVCFLLARRSRVYAYLVGPALWAGAGALGLFVDDAVRLIRERGWSVVGSWDFVDFSSDGMAAGQLVVVVGAIGATILLARGMQGTRVGRRVAAPLVQVGVVALPVVAGFTVAFAYADAVARGVASPAAADLAAPTVAAAGLACLGLLAARPAGFAWKDWGPQARRGLLEAITGAAYVLGTVAWSFTAGLGLPAGWVGAGLVGFGLLVAVLEADTARWVGRWLARGLAAAGLVLSFWDAGATLAAWGVVAAILLARPAWPGLRREMPALMPESLGGGARAVALWAGVLMAAGPGAARLAVGRGAPWVLAGSALAAGAARFLPGFLRHGRSLSVAPATALALSAVGLASWQAANQGPAHVVAAGVILLMAAGAVALALVPAVYRLAPAVLLATAGTMLLAREGFAALDLRASLADASSLGFVALVLLVPSLLWRAPGALLSGGLGHALLWVGFGMSLRSEVAALVGLGALVAFHGAEMVVAERGRPTAVTALAARCGPLRPLVESLPAVVVAVAMPFLTVVGGRQLPLVATQRPRSGLVLAATSWGYFGVMFAVRRERRRLLAALGIAVAGCGIAVAAPSQAGTLIATASAALLTAGCALILGRPGLSALSWVAAGAAGLIGAARLGVSAGDLRFVLYGMAVGLLVVPAVLDRLLAGPGGGIRSRWWQAPVAVGMLALPAALALVVADQQADPRSVAWLMLGGAGAYGLLGACTRAGGTVVPAAALAAIAYADLMQEWRSPFDEPVLWMPFAALLVLVHLVLPRRPLAQIATAPGPGVLVVGLAVCTLAGVLGIRSGDLSHVLAATAALLGLLGAVRRSLWWTGAGAALLAAGGAAYGSEGWSALALAVDAVAVGAVGTARRLRWWVAASALLAAGAYTTLAWWRNWDEATVVAVSAAAGGALACAGTVLLLRRAGGRLGLWAWPLLLLGQAGAVTVVAAASGLAEPGRFGVWAGVAAAEAVLAGAAAVQRVRPEWAAVSGLLVAAAYGLAAAWGEWNAVTVASVSAAVGGTLAAAAPLLWWWARADVVRIWAPVAFGLSQAAALAVCAAAGEFARPGAFGVWAGVAAGEALLATVVGAVRQILFLTAPAGLFWAVAYGLAAAWGDWDVPTLLAATSGVAGALGAAGLAMWLAASGARLRMWIPMLVLLAEAGAVTVATAAGELQAPARLGVWAGVAAAEALGLGLAALRESGFPYLREASAGCSVAALVLGLCALPSEGVLLPLLHLAAVLGAIALVAAGGEESGRWRPALWIAGAGAVVALPLLTAARLGGGHVAVGTVLIVCGAGCIGAGIRSGRWALLYLGMLVWLGAGLALAADVIGGNPHAWVLPIALVLLAIVELERLRARLAERHPPDQLRLAEWVLMTAPPLLAAVDMFSHRALGVLLAAEGVVLLSWALLTRVRRRLVVGLAAVGAAIVITAAFLVVDAVRRGGSGGTALLVLAIIAILLIVIGSVIEKSRARIGQAVQRIGAALETWE